MKISTEPSWKRHAGVDTYAEPSKILWNLHNIQTFTENYGRFDKGSLDR